MESLPVVGGKGVIVSDDPRLHDLDHEVNGFFVGEVDIPAVPLAKVCEGSAPRLPLRIYHQHDNIRGGPLCGMLERPKRVVAGPDASQFPPPTAALGRPFLVFKEGVEPAAQGCACTRTFAAAFDIDRNSTHGFAPSSPIRQRSPSWYRSSQ